MSFRSDALRFDHLWHEIFLASQKLLPYDHYRRIAVCPLPDEQKEQIRADAERTHPTREVLRQIIRDAVHDAAFTMALGGMLAYWTHVEEKMIEIMRQLLGGDPRMPARQIFRGMSSNHNRIKVLRTLLEKAPLNDNAGAVYDEVIDEFSKLNEKRNDFVHGLWYTHKQTGTIYLAEPTPDDFHFLDKREVKIKELDDMIDRMSDLWRKITGTMYSPPA